MSMDSHMCRSSTSRKLGTGRRSTIQAQIESAAILRTILKAGSVGGKTKLLLAINELGGLRTNRLHFGRISRVSKYTRSDREGKFDEAR